MCAKLFVETYLPCTHTYMLLIVNSFFKSSNSIIYIKLVLNFYLSLENDVMVTLCFLC